MALKAAQVQAHESETLGCNVIDHSLNSFTSKAMRQAGFVATTDSSHAEKSTGVLQLPAERSDAHRNLGSKTAARNTSRKQNRSKARAARKSVEKVFPEELLSDACNKDDELALSYKNPQGNVDNEARSSTDFMKHNSSPPVTSSFGNVYLEKFSETNVHNSKRFPECSSYEISAISGVFPNNDAKKTRNHLHNMQRKDQSRLIWQRCQKDRSMPSKRAALSLPSSFPIHGEQFVGQELSVTPYSSAIQKNSSCGTKTPESEEDVLCKGICVDARVESSPHVAEQGLTCEFYHSVSLAKPLGSIHSVELDKADANLPNFSQYRSNSWRTIRCHGSKSSYRHQHGSLPSHTELLPPYFPLEAKFNSIDRGTLDGIQPCVWLKWPTVNPVEDKTLLHFSNREWRDVSCLESNNPYRIKHSQDVNQQPSSRKWIPVCKKAVKIPKTASIESCDNNNDNSPLDRSTFHLERDLIALSDISSNLEIGNLISTREIGNTNPEVKDQKVELGKEFHLLITAQMAERAFISSYRLQVTSESVHQVTGYALADVERLLCCTTPVIASSYSCPTCDVSLHNQCSPSLCRDQIPNISLSAIWNWYEEPGNYGLKVNVDDPMSQKGCLANNTSSFHAHFVPLLSAIQLFGYRHLSTSCSKSEESSVENHDKQAKLHPSHFGNPVKSPATNHRSDYVHDGNESVGVSTQPLLSDAELIFEFFESEQPQRRMPLHNKIMELASRATSNNQVFGDPSKLECTNLDDLHPASWFSVAWYPIYRIPEGKLRAAFLTYHSLGYLVQQCMTTSSIDKSSLCVLFPIIGLQSYNAQGELWFSPNSEVESSLRELTSTLLKERIGTLEENALLFARGMVSKDHVTVTNRQPDYEFFMSRKH